MREGVIDEHEAISSPKLNSVSINLSKEAIMYGKKYGKKVLAAVFGGAIVMSPFMTLAGDSIEMPVKVEIKTPIKTKKSMDLDFGKINIIGPATVVIKGNEASTNRFTDEAAAKLEAAGRNTEIEEGNAIVDATKKGNAGLIIVSHGSEDMAFTIEVKYPDADTNLGTGVTLSEVEEYSSATEVEHQDVAGAGGTAAAADITAIFVGGKLDIEGDVAPQKYSGQIPIELSYR